MLVDRITHYFLTYKDMPDGNKNQCEITKVYGREEAQEVIRRSQKDYMDRFRDVKSGIVNQFMKQME
jgi:inorganic pyrophosphatase